MCHANGVTAEEYAHLHTCLPKDEDEIHEGLDMKHRRQRSETKGFHVLVKWPGGEQPWLILIKASSKEEARHIVESSDDVQGSQGKVVSVEDAARPLRSCADRHRQASRDLRRRLRYQQLRFLR